MQSTRGKTDHKTTRVTGPIRKCLRSETLQQTGPWGAHCVRRISWPERDQCRLPCLGQHTSRVAQHDSLPAAQRCSRKGRE